MVFSLSCIGVPFFSLSVQMYRKTVALPPVMAVAILMLKFLCDGQGAFRQATCT